MKLELDGRNNDILSSPAKYALMRPCSISLRLTLALEFLCSNSIKSCIVVEAWRSVKAMRLNFHHLIKRMTHIR